jgi:hypothetical protein
MNTLLLTHAPSSSAAVEGEGVMDTKSGWCGVNTCLLGAAGRRKGVIGCHGQTMVTGCGAVSFGWNLRLAGVGGGGGGGHFRISLEFSCGGGLGASGGHSA